MMSCGNQHYSDWPSFVRAGLLFEYQLLYENLWYKKKCRINKKGVKENKVFTRNWSFTEPCTLWYVAMPVKLSILTRHISSLQCQWWEIFKIQFLKP